MDIMIVAAVVLLINIPFGYWRANVKRRSFQWFAAIHVPIPFVVALRLFSGIGFEFITYPVVIGAFFLGQLLGGLIHRHRSKRGRTPLTSCLFMDLIKGGTS